MITQNLYIDMDDTLCKYREAWVADNRLGIQFPQSFKNFFKNLEPHEDAIEAVELLSRLYNVWILTAPSIYNPMSYMEKRLWVEEHLGFDMCSKLIISPNKGLIVGKEPYKVDEFGANEYGYVTHILIDDIIEGKGQENFTGELMQFGSIEYPDWKTIMYHLI